MGILLIAMMQLGASQEDGTPIISLMIDVDTPHSPNEDEVRSAEVNLHKMYQEITDRDETATLLLTQDVTSSRIRLLLAQYTVLSKFEFAISGNHSDDKLISLPLSEQEALISNSIEIAKASKVCGMSEVDVLGFIPPGFSQNQDTYKAIDNLSIQYDAGFQTGLIYAPGHEDDVWPYKIEGYDFSAVPISSINVSGDLLPLYDKKMTENGLNAAEWSEILNSKLQESAANDKPMVVLLSTSVSGSGEYFDALTNFLDYAGSENATFINVRDLVALADTGTLDIPEGGSYKCTTCGQDEGMDITIIRDEQLKNLTNKSELKESIEQEVVA